MKACQSPVHIRTGSGTRSLAHTSCLLPLQLSHCCRRDAKNAMLIAFTIFTILQAIHDKMPWYVHRLVRIHCAVLYPVPLWPSVGASTHTLVPTLQVHLPRNCVDIDSKYSKNTTSQSDSRNYFAPAGHHRQHDAKCIWGANTGLTT